MANKLKELIKAPIKTSEDIDADIDVPQPLRSELISMCKSVISRITAMQIDCGNIRQHIEQLYLNQKGGSTCV
jgi:hypothetical protein